MGVRVLVTPRSFGKHNDEPMRLLKQEGYELIVNPYGRIMTSEEMRQAASDVDAVIVGVDPLDRTVLQDASRLKAVAKYGVGTDNIDLDFCRERSINVSVTHGANSNAVADYTLALMLAVARRIVPIDAGCRMLDWGKVTAVDLHRKTLGLIGLGQIGKGVAKRAKGFEMEVLAYDQIRDEAFAKESGISYADGMDTLIRQSDFISLHLPLTPSTQHMFDTDKFALMKSTAVLINTARGGLIDEDALCTALKERRIWGAGIDVFEEEPPANRELLQLNNLVIGSHTAASTFQAIDNMGLMAAKSIIDYFRGGSIS